MTSSAKRRVASLAIWAMAGAITVGAMATPVMAAITPGQKQQVPGYFRMAVGAFDVTALYDGFVGIDAALLTGGNIKAIESSLARSFQKRSIPVQTAVNAYLVDTHKNVILVDTGTAKLFGDNLGFVHKNLRAAGYAPSQIDTVLLTHLHPDHAGGLLTPTGEMAFSHAQVFVSKADAAYWLSEKTAASAPENQKMLFKMARDAVAPYIAAGRMTIFDDGQTLREGVTGIRASGHTPGHTAYLFSSQDQQLLAWGDIVHNAAVQFPDPETAIEYDWDKPKAVATRRKLFALSGARKFFVAGAHLPFPGIGRVHASRAHQYSWVPVEYHATRGLP